MAKTFTPSIKKILKQAGCTFVRQGKGDHEIWQRPDGYRFMVDNHIESRNGRM